jgi:hypothetical protein
MNDEQIRKIIDGSHEYDDSKESTLRTMLGDFYNRKMLSVAVFIWAWGIVVIAAAVYCAVQFFRNVEIRDQIMYAALFVCCVQFLALTKIFAWQMIHRNGILREIKRLELRIAELPRKLDSRPSDVTG